MGVIAVARKKWLFLSSTLLGILLKRRPNMHELDIPLQADHRVQTLEERRAAGRALRSKAPRSSHAMWEPAADRPDPLHLLEEQNRARLPHLVPLRYSRMAVSAFTFLRGAAIMMAYDLVATPVTGIYAQICGDAHLNNFGIYATPERNQVFDVNDFDETLPGPWEWDIKRLAASIVLGGRANRFTAAINRQAVLGCVQAYREHMWKYSEMRHIDVWYSRIDYENSLQFVHPDFRWYINKQRDKSRERSSLQVFPKLTTLIDGRPRFKDEPPLIAHLHNDDLAHQLIGLLESYRSTVQEDRQVFISKYHCVDVAQKVVGVGSVGTRCYVLLLLGNDSNDPLLLQVKEAQASVLERHLGPGVDRKST